MPSAPLWRNCIPESSTSPVRPTMCVSGHGPYQAMTPEYYFTKRATTKFHSELGMPNIVTMDSLNAMMPEESMWPQGNMWGIHDFSLAGAQGGASFRDRIDTSYGGADNAADWVSLAQFVNYEGYRAMFEAQSKNRMGLLDLDEPSDVALHGLADLRLLPGAHRRLLRRQACLRTPAHSVEPGDGPCGSGELQRRNRQRAHRHRGDPQPRWLRPVEPLHRARQQRGQHRFRPADRVSGRPLRRPLHPPEADPRQPRSYRRTSTGEASKKETTVPCATCPK